MDEKRRLTLFRWKTAIVAVIVCVFGIWWFMSNSSVAQAPTEAERKRDAPSGYICLGKIDVPPGVANLYPAQPGRVLFVAPEGTIVEKNQLLLSVDPQLAKLRVAEAKSDLGAANAKLMQARFTVVDNRNKIAMLEKSIAIAEKKRSIANSEWKLKQSLQQDGIVTQEELDIAKEKYNIADLAVLIEKKKLETLTKYDPQWLVDQALANVNGKQAQLDKAELGVRECELKAPSAGLVLRVIAKNGELLGPNPKYPALQFCPVDPKTKKPKMIVRAEVLQEWAHLVREKQQVVVEDDSRSKRTWKGTVKSISDWFAHKRDIRIEPFMLNDIITLECIVEIDPTSGPKLRIGQRVKVKFHE